MDALPANYTPSPLERLQLDAAARLEADAFFANVTVVVMRPRAKESFLSLQQKVDQALSGVLKKNGKAGLTLTVFMPSADGTDVNAPGPRLDFGLVVRVEEVPLFNMGPNGTGISCEEAALRVLQLLHHFNPGRGNVLYVAQQALTPREAEGKVVIDVALDQKSGIEGLAKVALPAISATAAAAPAVVTLTCATAGATIRYTTDGSYPCAGNTAAQIYSAPVTLSTACTLRVAADKSGSAQSDVRQLILT